MKYWILAAPERPICAPLFLGVALCACQDLDKKIGFDARSMSITWSQRNSRLDSVSIAEQ